MPRRGERMPTSASMTSSRGTPRFMGAERDLLEDACRRPPRAGSRGPGSTMPTTPASTCIGHAGDVLAIEQQTVPGSVPSDGPRRQPDRHEAHRGLARLAGAREADDLAVPSSRSMPRTDGDLRPGIAIADALRARSIGPGDARPAGPSARTTHGDGTLRTSSQRARRCRARIVGRPQQRPPPGPREAACLERQGALLDLGRWRP